MSALAVLIQANFINLLMDLQADLGLTDLFIAHGIFVVAQTSTQIAVMTVGKPVEQALVEIVWSKPMHPCAKARMSENPAVDPERTLAPMVLGEETPCPASLAKGCRFNAHCPFLRDACRETGPEWREAPPRHFRAYYFAQELWSRRVRSSRCLSGRHWNENHGQPRSHNER